MESTQFYKYTTWGMLCLNLILIGFLFFGRPTGGHQMRAIDALKMDDSQHDAFLASAKRHELLIESLTKTQTDLLKPYFQQLIDTNATVNETQLFTSLQTIEKQKIKSTYRHFEEIKHFLKKEQEADFKLFMNRILEKILSEQEKKSHPPKDF